MKPALTLLPVWVVLAAARISVVTKCSLTAKAMKILHLVVNLDGQLKLLRSGLQLVTRTGLSLPLARRDPCLAHIGRHAALNAHIGSNAVLGASRGRFCR